MAKLRVQHWLICIYVHLWPFMFEAIPDGAPSLCYLTASQPLHPTPPHSISPHRYSQVASRDKLTLWSTSWCFFFFKPFLLDTVPRWRCCFWSVYGMVRRMYLHQNVKTSDNILMMLGFDECAGDDNRAVILWPDTLGWPSCFRAFSKSHATLPFFIHCICAPN